MAISYRKIADFCLRRLKFTEVTCPVSRCECICINHPLHHNSQNKDAEQQLLNLLCCILH